MRWPTRICRVGVSFLPYPRGDRLDVDPLLLLGREPYEPEEFAWPGAFPLAGSKRLGAAFIVLIFHLTFHRMVAAGLASEAAASTRLWYFRAIRLRRHYLYGRTASVLDPNFNNSADASERLALLLSVCNIPGYEAPPPLLRQRFLTRQRSIWNSGCWFGSCRTTSTSQPVSAISRTNGIPAFSTKWKIVSLPSNIRDGPRSS